MAPNYSGAIFSMMDIETFTLIFLTPGRVIRSVRDIGYSANACSTRILRSLPLKFPDTFSVAFVLARHGHPLSLRGGPVNPAFSVVNECLAELGRVAVVKFSVSRSNADLISCRFVGRFLADCLLQHLAYLVVRVDK